ncbi:MAG TPA: hypothetical protein VHT34_05395 [Clostridia bacterium]|nr:hypothetical protein [Clostridia bacterium]
MNANQGPKKLNRFVEYLPGFIKFYKIKNEYIAPLVFIVLLGALFILTALKSNIVTDNSINKVLDMVNSNDIDYAKYFKYLSSLSIATCLLNLTYVGSNLISKIVTSVYLAAYIKDQKDEPYFFKSILLTSVRSLKNIILTSVDFYAVVLLGLALLLLSFGSVYAAVLVMPLVFAGCIGWGVLKLFFIFSNCIVLDKGKGFSASIKSSMKLIEGSRGSIFLYIIVFSVLAQVTSVFIASLFSSLSSLIYLVFIPTFIDVIARLMQVRFVARMYVDLEYGQVEKEEEF